MGGNDLSNEANQANAVKWLAFLVTAFSDINKENSDINKENPSEIPQEVKDACDILGEFPKDLFTQAQQAFARMQNDEVANKAAENMESIINDLDISEHDLNRPGFLGAILNEGDGKKNKRQILVAGAKAVANFYRGKGKVVFSDSLDKKIDQTAKLLSVGAERTRG